MTWFFTHIALEGLIVWFCLSESRRNYFRQNKNFFLLLNFVAMLPDLDYFIGMHRSFTHSFVIILICLLGGILIGYRYKTSYPNFTNNWILAIFFWFFHIILDLDYYGSLALFFPLDDTMYDLTPYISYSTLLYPLIVGLGIDVTHETYSEGMSSYFINLSPETRFQIFLSDSFNSNFNELLLHLLIVFLWCMLVCRPNLAFSAKFSKLGSLTPRISHYGNLCIKYLRAPIVFVGLLILVVGVIYGPLIGPAIVDTEENSTRLRFSGHDFSFSASIELSFTHSLLDSTAPTHLQTTTFIPVSSTLNATTVFTSKPHYNLFQNNVSRLFQQYYNTNTTNSTLAMDDFRVAYLANVSYFLSLSQLFFTNGTTNTDISVTEFTVVILLTNFTVNQFTLDTGTNIYVALGVRLVRDRPLAFFTGYVGIFSGLVLIFSPSVKHLRPSKDDETE